MKQYHDLLRYVLDHGERRDDRTGVGTRAVFGAQARYDLRKGFPLVTTKKVNFDAVVRELLWFLSGSTNVRDLHPCRIWDAWADEQGELGPVYGAQWRGTWCGGSVPHPGAAGPDQIVNLISGLKQQPTSRRHVVSAWSVTEIDEMRLPPCHALFQCYVSNRGELDLQLYQRSADLAVGVPFNIASYALLLTMLAQECGYEPRYFIHTMGDAHIYENHVAGVEEQLLRDPLPLPCVAITEKPMLELTVGDFQLIGYQHHPAIKFEVAV